MLVSNARDAFDELSVDAHRQLDRDRVGADDDAVTCLERALRRVGSGELELCGWTLEGELIDAFDDGSREERPVTDEPKLADEMPVGGTGQGGHLRLGSGRRRLVGGAFRKHGGAIQI